MAGSDAGTLLHHLTTNNIKALRPGFGCDAALITSKARLLDILTVFRDSNGYLVVTSPNRRAMFAPHARKFVLFRQDISINDTTDTSALIGIFGPQAATALAKVGLDADDSAAPNVIQTLKAGELEVFAARTGRLPGGGFFVWSTDAAQLRALFTESELPHVDNETYNILRIEDGIPVAGLEITEDFNPWEANLDAMISLSKGCYNGQEIVARLNTYQKIKQRLRGVKLQSPLASALPVPLKIEGRDATTITSSAVSPIHGPVALAYVRTAWNEAGSQLEIEQQNGVVSNLPFENATETE